jgi:hypothetical protein
VVSFVDLALLGSDDCSTVESQSQQRIAALISSATFPAVTRVVLLDLAGINSVIRGNTTIVASRVCSSAAGFIRLNWFWQIDSNESAADVCDAFRHQFFVLAAMPLGQAPERRDSCGSAL